MIFGAICKHVQLCWSQGCLLLSLLVSLLILNAAHREGKPAVRQQSRRQEGRQQAGCRRTTESRSIEKPMCRLFQRIATGKAVKATAEEIAQAKEALDVYGGLPKCDQVAFATSFFSNKNGKNFGFIKEYSEKVQSSKKVKQAMNENHFTRIAVLIVKKHMRASLSHPLTSTPPLLSQYMRFRRIYLCVCWHNSPEIHAIMA